MIGYRITERGSRFIVGTEQEAVLICGNRQIAHRVVADAKLLETLTAKQIFCRRATHPDDEWSATQSCA